jgi:hypothetical protein
MVTVSFMASSPKIGPALFIPRNLVRKAVKALALTSQRAIHLMKASSASGRPCQNARVLDKAEPASPIMLGLRRMVESGIDRDDFR